MGWASVLAPFLKPFLEWLYFVVKDIARGSAERKRKKARDRVGKDFDDGFGNV